MANVFEQIPMPDTLIRISMSNGSRYRDIT